MIEEDAVVPTPDGPMPTAVFRPDGDGSFPPVIFYMDAPGIRPELYEMSREIAAAGYLVVLPDLYHRFGKVSFDPETMGRPERAEMLAVMDRLSNAMVMRDTGGLLDWLKGRADARPGPVGCVGHCMSGQFVLTAAATYPAEFAAVAAFYGTRMVTDKPDSPHLLADGIKAELYLGFAEEDQHVPDNVVPDLRAALDAAGVTYGLEVWAGTRHGFAFPRRWCYDRAAAEKAQAILLDLFARRPTP